MHVYNICLHSFKQNSKFSLKKGFQNYWPFFLLNLSDYDQSVQEITWRDVTGGWHSNLRGITNILVQKRTRFCYWPAAAAESGQCSQIALLLLHQRDIPEREVQCTQNLSQPYTSQSAFGYVHVSTTTRDVRYVLTSFLFFLFFSNFLETVWLSTQRHLLKLTNQTKNMLHGKM